MKKTILTLTATICILHASEPKLDGKTLQLKSLESGNCIQVEGNNSDNGTKLIQYPCETNNPLQKLTFTKNNNAYSITINNGKNISVAVQSKSNGIHLVQGEDTTLFDISLKDKGFTLKAKHSNKYVSTTGHNTDIVQIGKDNQANQLWNVHTNNIYKSCKAILDAGEDIGDGIYTIDPDGEGIGQPFEVRCDMTTDGGGWTEIIKDSTTSLDDLAKFGDTSHISSTFYSDPARGIGWGTTDRYYKEFLIKDLQFTQMKITVSGNYNNPQYGLGILLITDQSNKGKYWDESIAGNISMKFSDPWGGPSFPYGQDLYVNNNEIFKKLKIDILNESYQLESYTPYIHMTGYTSNRPYTKRFINKLLVR